jgi:hypothetical protein
VRTENGQRKVRKTAKQMGNAPHRKDGGSLPDKPDLIVHGGDLPATARALRDQFSTAGGLFDRGKPAKIVHPADGGPPLAVCLTINNVVIEAHRLCRPVKVSSNGEHVPTTLPERVARMYLDMLGEWNLPPLAGVSSAPLLADDGRVMTHQGYDPDTGLWCANVPVLTLSNRPTRGEAEAAFMTLRTTFRTFPFADSPRVADAALGIDVVDVAQPPAGDESAFLAALMTAVCRSSLLLAPGFIAMAPSISGAGSGKGLLVRAICTVAFGVPPRAFTAGSERHELDKRLAAELIEASPALFLDNVNGAVLRSETLASVLTERPARVRVLGESRMVALNCAAFIAVTGNGLAVSEDLARRFIVCELDPRCEDPESRPFAPGFLDQIANRRADLLAAALTVWRWGRHNVGNLVDGRPLGSYETWSRWVRDPLVTMGCRDPVERIGTVKANDPQRRRIVELFQVWWDCHKDRPMKAAEIDERVRNVADPQGRGRQFLATYLARLAGTRAGGFVLTRQEAAGQWGAATYALQRTAPDTAEGAAHTDDSEHRSRGRARGGPMTPMTPMPDDLDAADVPAGGETVV